LDEDENEVKKKKEEGDEDVDVVTVDKIAAYSSEDEDELWFIPTAPERDSPSLAPLGMIPLFDVVSTLITR